ncbi:MAG: ComF family protein [Caldimonas sp.]
MQSTRWFDGGLSALALPSLCAVCRSWDRRRLCADCVRGFAPALPRCRRCALEVPTGTQLCGACITEPPPFDATVAATTYGYPWDRLIAAYKFHAALDLAPAFADLLLRAGDAAATPAPTLLLPVPLSRERLRERGYNQAWELARRLARKTNCAADPDLLLRIKDTPHQLALAPDRRAANVRGAFAVEPRRSAELRGRSVGIVDDVMTTAATAAELARVLRAAGAARVDIWVVARTPRVDAA